MKVILLWIFFNALIPLLPIPILWGISWLVEDPNATPPRNALTLFNIIRDGQVFFYCTALTSVAIGDLRKAPKDFDTSLWLVGFLLILFLSISAFAVAAYNKNVVQEKRFGWVSVALAITTILSVIVFRGKAGLL